jgi:AcrR family transcriptional regulator
VELPEPPRPQRRSRPGRKRALDRDAVVAAAVRVLDAEGLEAVTLRRVATELGVGVASLYQYVEGKDELVEALFDHVMGEVELGDLPDERPWQEQLKDLIRRTRAVFARHGDVAHVSLGRIPVGPNGLRGMETMLAVLRRSDLPDQVVAYAGDLIGLLVGAAAYEDSLHAQSGIELADLGGYVDELRRYFEALPRDRFPNLVQLAGPLTRFVPHEDERFEFMLDVLVAGLAAQAKR